MDAILPGSINQSTYFRLRDSTTGLAKTNLAFNSAGASCSFTRNREAAVEIVLVELASADAPHADGGFIKVSDTIAKGLYRVDLPNAAVAAGSRTICVSIEFDGVIEETKEMLLDGSAAANFTTEGQDITVE